MTNLQNLIKADKDNKAIFGTKKTIKALKNGEVEEIYLASNCPESIKKTLKSLIELNNITMTTLEENNEEFSTACKKPFLISVACILNVRAK